MNNTLRNTPEFNWESFDPKDILVWLQKSIDTAENIDDKNELQYLFDNIQAESLSQSEITDQLNLLESKWIIDLSEEKNKLDDLAEKVKSNTHETWSTKFTNNKNLSPQERQATVQTNKDVSRISQEKIIKESRRIPNRLKELADIA